MHACDEAIPRTSGEFPLSPAPWWSRESEFAYYARKFASRRFQGTKPKADKVMYNRARSFAFARLVTRRAFRDSWRQYVSTVNIVETYSNMSCFPCCALHSPFMLCSTHSSPNMSYTLQPYTIPYTLPPYSALLTPAMPCRTHFSPNVPKTL